MPRSDSYPGSLDRRPSGSWRWRVSVEGQRHSETFEAEELEAEREPGESLEDVAARQARDAYDELVADSRRGEPTKVSVAAFTRRFTREHVATLATSSRTAYKGEMKALRSFFEELRGDPMLRKISRGDVKRYLSWRRMHKPDGSERPSPLSNRTLRDCRAIFHKMFEEALELELVAANPVARVEAPSYTEREPVLLSDAQLEALLSELEGHPMARLYVLLLAETGVRDRSEALWLRWEDVDLQEGFLRVVSGRGGHETKSRKGRWVPLTPRLSAALRAHAADYRMKLYDGQRSPWIYHHVRPYRSAEPGDRRKSFDYRVDKAAEAAELPEEWRLHDLRHRRCTSWLAAGHSPALVRKALGHSDLSVTLKYEHLVKGDLGSLVEEEAREELAELGTEG